MANSAGVSGAWRTARARRAAGALAALVTIGTVLVTLGVSIPEYQASPFERSVPAWLIALIGVEGLALIAAASFSRSQRPTTAVGLAVASIGLLVPTWAGWTTLVPQAQAYALAIAPIALAGVAHVGLGWSPTARPTMVLSVVYALAGGAILVHAVGYNPLVDPGCAQTCANIQPLAGGLLSGRAAYALTAALTGTAGVIAGIALIREGMRRGSGIVAWATLVAVATLALPWIAHAIAWADPGSRFTALLPGVIAGLLIGLAPLGAERSARRMRLEVRELVDRLSEEGLVSPRSGHVRGVQFAFPGDGRWIDASGATVERPGEPARSVVISDSSGPALRLEVAPTDDPAEVMATLMPATMLALQNLRLAAVSRARLADVRGSQRRIVDASDTERQRIERDLHDGAQQRLVSASFQLSLARTRLVEGGETLTRAEAAVGEALAHLRQLGHGIFPATLATEGLNAALEDLVAASEVPATLDLPDLTMDHDVAMAAYAVVETILSHARRSTREVSVHATATVDTGRAELRVDLMGDSAAAQLDLVDVGDRVGAVGGTLAIESTAGGAQITAVLPCA